MSKKSRKRNKKILAAIGIGLGAAALASKKRNASIQANEAKEAGFAESTKKPSIKDVSGPKKDTAKKPIPGIRVAKNSITASKYDKDTPNKTFSGPDRKYDYVNRASEKNTAGVAKPKKSLMATVFPKSGAADEFKASTQDYNRGNYKSGGKVKGCGKALRGFGKAMKGKR